MAEPAPGSSSIPPRSPAGRRTSGPPTLEDALERIQALEDRLARYEEVLTVNDDGSVELSATGQLRLTAANNVYLESGSNWIELGITGVEINASASLKLECSDLRIQAAIVRDNAAMTEASGVIRCETLITNSVVSSSYTPGAGNVW